MININRNNNNCNINDINDDENEKYIVSRRNLITALALSPFFYSSMTSTADAQSVGGLIGEIIGGAIRGGLAGPGRPTRPSGGRQRPKRKSKSKSKSKGPGRRAGGGGPAGPQAPE